MSESTAVAPLQVPADNELEAIRKRGASEVAHRKEIAKIFKQLDGTQWGHNLSVPQRGLVAEFIKVTRANVLLHVDFLGNRPYLNSTYYSDLASNHPAHHHYEQRDLSLSVETAMRERAEKYYVDADKLDASKQPERAKQRRDAAWALEQQADTISIDRAKWSPRATATVVIETTVYRYTNAAMTLIAEGKVPANSEHLVTVVECNWAGGHGIVKIGSMDKKDPIGDANPGTTARTRSLRRTLVKAYSAWMGEYDKQIEKAEEFFEAEYTIVDSAPQNATLQVGTGAVEAEVIEQQATTQAGLPQQQPPVEDFDFKDATARIMATWKDAGIKDRKAWSIENGFPASTKEWTPDQFRDAWKRLVEPVKEEVRALLGDGNLEDLSLAVLKKAKPEYLKDWNALRGALQAQAETSEGEDVDDEDQGEAFPSEL